MSDCFVCLVFLVSFVLLLPLAVYPPKLLLSLLLLVCDDDDDDDDDNDNDNDVVCVCVHMVVLVVLIGRLLVGSGTCCDCVTSV
ncbi:unnamed protein product [Ectocarpus sp. 4 AP-2014]